MTHPADDPAPGGAWLEARIPAVLAAVLGTGVLVVVWRALRHLAG